jgi:hypothetical protein
MTKTLPARKRIIRSSPWWLWIKEISNYRKKPLLQKRLWADYASIRHWRRKISSSFRAPRPNRVALIGSMGGYIYSTKLEAMLGLGLSMAGWKVLILLGSRGDMVQRRIFGAFGFEHFIYWEDFNGRPDQVDAEVGRAMQEWKGTRLTLQSIKQWTLGPCWLGPQVISMLHRRRHRVEVDLDSPQVQEGLLDVARQAAASAYRAVAILEKVQPQLLLLMEPNYATFAPLADHAIDRKIRVIQMVQPNRDDAMYFWSLDRKTRRQHPSSVSAATLQRVADLPWTASEESKLQEAFEFRYSGKWFLQKRNQVNAQAVSRQQLVQSLGLDPSKKIVTVFSHVLWDANLFYGADLFDDYGDWFVQTARAAYANPGVNWLIKLHPANIFKRRDEGITSELAETVLLREKCGPLPAYVRLLAPDCGVSSLSLYEISDCGVTVRGTCGLEMPCFGTPVITAGTGRYSGLGFTLDSSTREEYLSRLASVQQVSPLTDAQVLLAKKHAYTLFVLRPWKMRSFRAEFKDAPGGVNGVEGPLLHNLFPTVGTSHEIAALGDLSKWAEWAEHGTTPDYIDVAGAAF